MAEGLTDLLAAAFGGGVVVKGLDYLYAEYRRRRDVSKSAKDLVNKHLDPIIKAADELVGKIRSLAQSDFKELRRISRQRQDVSLGTAMPRLEVVFLFAQLWARIQILRTESIYINLSSNVKGRQLLAFFRALEATKSRLVDRAWQRGMGEALVISDNGNFRSISYFDFVVKYQSSSEYREWFHPIERTLGQVNHTRIRQRLLVYGVILHSLIETLDKRNQIARYRPAWSHKLSAKSKAELRYRIFGVHLKFVRKPKRYLSERNEG